MLKHADISVCPGSRSIYGRNFLKNEVKFLQFKSAEGKKTKRYQHTAIDDATRIRALKIYQRHNQANAINLINYVVERFPFRIKKIRTDRGREFQASFHWHMEDMGMQHIYIRPRSPHLNGKVERSDLTDQREFYQLLDYTYDVDLRKKSSLLGGILQCSSAPWSTWWQIPI